jgi:hypothetical protein
VVYDFPKTRLIDGPQQIESRIDQNAQLSGQLTLWNQQGSHVRRGSLLVIPSGRALLYAEPIYLQAAQSPMPELRLVVLALQDRLAYGPTFEAALASLYGGEVSSMRTPEAPQLAPGNPRVQQSILLGDGLYSGALCESCKCDAETFYDLEQVLSDLSAGLCRCDLEKGGRGTGDEVPAPT